jgi:outer membrane receptor protein involved in Fe transport
MNHSISHTLRKFSFGSLGFLPLACGFAQEIEPKKEEPSPQGKELKEIVVTSDLWQSLLSDIPASVSVYDAEALKNPNIRHFADLIERTPNLTYSGGTSRPRYFQLRGMGENSQFEGETPDFSVRFLVDDIDFTGIASVASAFDIEQVEVLRGPQAGSFGVNAAGGMVRMISASPTPYWTGRSEVTAGQDDLFAAGLAFGGPVLQRNPEELMFRFSLYRNQSDGFRKNVFLNEDTNALDEWTSRFRLTWNPNRDLRVDATFFHAYLDNGYDEFALDNNGRNTYSDEPGRDFQRSIGGSVRVTYDGWQGVKLTSITSGTFTDSFYSYDEDWTSASYQGVSELTRERGNFAQEMRLDSTPDAERAFGFIDRWTLGAYAGVIQEKSQYIRGEDHRVPRLDTDFTSANYALFGQAGHDVSKRDRLILGLRLEHIDSSADSLNPSNGDAFSPDFSDTMFGGKCTYEHDVMDDLMGFASLARGYRAGGLNVDAREINPAKDPLNFGTEDLWNYELGLRGHWWDGRLTSSLTGFYMQRHNTQVRYSDGQGGNFSFAQENGGDSSITGVEIESALQVNTQLSLYNSIGLMESSIDAYTLSKGGTGGGRELAATPAQTFSIGGRYQHECGFFSTLDLTGRSEFYESTDHDEKRDGFFQMNASIGYTKDDWTVSLWVRNLLDEDYSQRVFFFGNDPATDYTPTRYDSLAQPRQIGITVRRDF